MAAPNIVSVSSIYGKTTGVELNTTTTTGILTCATNKVLKVNSIICANIDGSSAADVTINFFDTDSDGGGTDIVGIGKYHYDSKVTNFYSTATANYLPLSGGTIETTSTLGKTENVCIVPPFNGTLERAVFRSEIAQNGDLIFAIHESSDGT